MHAYCVGTPYLHRVDSQHNHASFLTSHAVEYDDDIYSIKLVAHRLISNPGNG
jgi:hypothetical protein